MDEIDCAALARRLVEHYLESCPECGETIESLVEKVDVEVRCDEVDGPLLQASLHGRTITLGFDGSLQGAIQAVEAIAELSAWDDEGDRWIVGDGWREYQATSLFDDALALLLGLIREHVCATAALDGDSIVADGELHIIDQTRAGSLTVAGSALVEALRHHAEPTSAAGAILTDVEEALHAAALDHDGAVSISIA